MRLEIIFRILFFAAAFSLPVSCADKQVNASVRGNETEETITISGAFALYPLIVKWGDEFKKLHPNVTFEISAGGSGKGISDALGGLVDLGAVSRGLKKEEESNGAFPVAVAKDAVVATFNTGNPDAKEIFSKGVTKDFFTGIFSTGTIKDWKQGGFPVAHPIHAYTRSDASGAGETWAKYVGLTQEDLLGIGVFGDPGLLQSVQNDPDAIGYNNMAYVYDADTHKPLEGISVLPLDLNGNGKIDAEENFYGTQQEFVAAVTAGKYPSPPARELFLVSKNTPQRKIVIEFLRWVLTDGQKFVAESGYIPLDAAQLGAEQNKFIPVP